ncbi:MAG: hypothetical protein WB762_24435 [Candidatus Sulfotelmatobacter sp.]
MKDLAKFEAEYDTSHEDSTLQARGVFIKSFPLSSLKNLTVDEYVVGHHNPTFCNLGNQERGLGLTSSGPHHFIGIYFGRTKSDPHENIFSQRNSAKANRGSKMCLLYSLVQL